MTFDLYMKTERGGTERQKQTRRERGEKERETQREQPIRKGMALKRKGNSKLESRKKREKRAQ